MKQHLKKIFFLISLLFITSSAFSQVQYYKATTYAYKTNAGYGWSNWTDWLESGILITIDVGNDIINTSGNSPQVYAVLSVGKAYTDSSGGRQVKFSCIDHEGVRCTIRLRIETNGNSQLYIDYADLMLVFNVKRI